MGISKRSLLSSFLCLLLLFQGSWARLVYGSPSQRRRSGEQCQCLFGGLNAPETTRRVVFEVGFSTTEYWVDDTEELGYAGVAAIRQNIEHSLLLPSYSNAPPRIYIGLVPSSPPPCRGIAGAAATPGWPESYQSSKLWQQQYREGPEEQEECGQMFGDEDRKTSFPSGNNAINVQLARNDRAAASPSHIQPAGTHQGGRQRLFQRGAHRSPGSNILSGFEVELLSEAAAGVKKETPRNVLHGQNDGRRGHNVRVEVRPQAMEERQWEQRGDNRLDEAMIRSMRIRQNRGEPARAAMYTPGGGRITVLNNSPRNQEKWCSVV